MHWYHTFEIIECGTPSRNDDIDFETESRYRKEGARFIMELGNKLGLRYLTMATGIVFYHRFYMFHSFKAFSRWVTGATCLFLAGKVEETPKKCRDILKCAQQMLTDSQFKTFGDNPREELMISERILLQTIKFDLQTSHPYEFLIKYGKSLKGDKSKINEFVQKAWIFINDSLSTPLCLVYQPQIIALAVLLLAFKMSNQDIRDFMYKSRVEWWKSFHSEATEKDLEEICKDLMNLYEGKPPRRRFPFKHQVTRKERLSESTGNSPITSINESPKTPNSPVAKRQKKLLSSSAENTPTLSVKSNSSEEAVKQSTENTADSKASFNPEESKTEQIANEQMLDDISPHEISKSTDSDLIPTSKAVPSSLPGTNVVSKLETSIDQANSPSTTESKNNPDVPSSIESLIPSSSIQKESSTAAFPIQTTSTRPLNPMPLMAIDPLEPQSKSYSLGDKPNSPAVPALPPGIVSNESQQIADDIPPPNIIPDVRENLNQPRFNSNFSYQQTNMSYDHFPQSVNPPVPLPGLPSLPRLMFQKVPNQMSHHAQEPLPPSILPQLPTQSTHPTSNMNPQVKRGETQQSYNQHAPSDMPTKQVDELNYTSQSMPLPQQQKQSLPPPPILDHMSSFFQSNQNQSSYSKKAEQPSHGTPMQISKNTPPRPMHNQRPLMSPSDQSPTPAPPFSPYQNQPSRGGSHHQQGFFPHQGHQPQFMNTPPNRGNFNDHRMQSMPHQNFENYGQRGHNSHRPRHPPRGPNMHSPFPQHFQGGPWM